MAARAEQLPNTYYGAVCEPMIGRRFRRIEIVEEMPVDKLTAEWLERLVMSLERGGVIEQRGVVLYRAGVRAE